MGANIQLIWDRKLDIWLQVFAAIMLAAFDVWRIGAPGVRTAILCFVGVYLVALLFVRRLPAGARINFLVLQVSTIGALYLGEYYLEWAASGLSKQNEISRLKRQGIAAYPTVPPATWYFDFFRQKVDAGAAPLVLSGVADVATVFCEESSGWITYQSDAHGFRNSPASSDSGNDLTLIGASAVQGACVHDRDTIAGVLSSLGLSTRNLGMAGSGPLFQLATLEEYGLNNKQVIWFFAEAKDLADLRRETTSELLLKYLSGHESQGLVKRQHELDAFLRSGIKELESSSNRTDFIQLKRLRTALGLSGIGVSEEAKPAVDPLLPTFRAVLARAAALTEEKGIPLTLVYLPTAERYAQAAQYYSDMEHKVLDIACSEGVRAFSVSSRLAREPKPIGYFTKTSGHYGHMTEEGYRIVATSVRDMLSGKETSACSARAQRAN